MLDYLELPGSLFFILFVFIYAASAQTLSQNKPIPVPRATRRNYTGDFGGGLMYMLSPKRAVSVGCRYFHVSNANGQINNPGFNAGIFYINYSFLSR